MARINLNQAGNFTQSGGGGFFSLKDDGDSAKVRFLYEEHDGSDVDFFVVHRVEVNGKERYVNCLAIDDEGAMHKDNCPLCQAGHKTIEKLFLQVYNEDAKEVQTWDRGKNFVKTILTFINRYKSLCAQEFEIVRNGKKGDQGTTYTLFAGQTDGCTLEELAEEDIKRGEILGGLVIDATVDEMYGILDGTYKPASKQAGQQQSNNITPRRGNRQQETNQEEPPTPRRGRGRTRREASDQDNF